MGVVVTAKRTSGSGSSLIPEHSVTEWQQSRTAGKFSARVLCTRWVAIRQRRVEAPAYRGIPDTGASCRLNCARNCREIEANTFVSGLPSIAPTM